MPDLETWLIIILIIGVIVSNLAVLKYSAKMKMTQFGKEHKQTSIKKNATTNKNQPHRDSEAPTENNPPSTSTEINKD